MVELRKKLFSVYNRAMQRFSNVVFQSILRTPQIRVNEKSNTVLYTVLDKTNCRAYLLAAKSFLRFYSDIRVVVQSDGSLKPRQIQELSKHLPGIQINTRQEAECLLHRSMNGALRALVPSLNDCNFFIPFKLLNVIYGFRGKDVILFDSDLLFLREPHFIIEWITRRTPYSFHSDGGNSLTKPFHQMGFEFSSVDVADFNAGFIGFPNNVEETQLTDVFRRIVEFDKGLLQNWEIEQAIWSVLFNAFPGPINLARFGKQYVGSGWKTFTELDRDSVLVHFVGSIRFKNLRYIRLARKVMEQIRRDFGRNPSCRKAAQPVCPSAS